VTTGGRHPLFTSPLRWHERLVEAVAAARDHNRRVMVVHGACAGTRLMVERTLAKEELVEFIEKHFILLASRAESVDAELGPLLEALPRREPAPVVLYLAVDRDAPRVVHSTVNGRAPAVLLNDMLDGTTRS
jgi:hypothetical protein